MLAYLVNFIQAFTPLALAAGLLAPLLPGTGDNKPFRSLALVIVCGAVAGFVAYPVALRHELATAVRTTFHGIALAALLLDAGVMALPEVSRLRRLAAFPAALLFLAALSALSAFLFSAFAAEQALSASTVLNTELILNLTGILAGLLLTGLLVSMTAYGAARTGIARPLLLFLCTLLAARWGGELLLGMMRLEMVELTSARVALVAKTGKYAHLIAYLLILETALLAVVFFRKRTKVTAAGLTALEPAKRRKTLSSALREMRWIRSTLGLVLVIASLFLYHDLYASRPPKITKPLHLQPDNSGMIRVKIEDLSDGNLHRYAYVTDDGHVVRFFMINRSGGKKIGVVYDACMLCGDMGYLQEKNEVICIACNVRIFIPSIGKAGGCNPIPLPHAVEGGYVTVSAAELDKGARYFSEVVTVKVKDPVSGRELISRDAPHRYEYKGRNYFFESIETLEKFKAEPDRFVGSKESRYYRVQGFQGA